MNSGSFKNNDSMLIQQDLDKKRLDTFQSVNTQKC